MFRIGFVFSILLGLTLSSWTWSYSALSRSSRGDSHLKSALATSRLDALAARVAELELRAGIAATPSQLPPRSLLARALAPAPSSGLPPAAPDPAPIAAAPPRRPLRKENPSKAPPAPPSPEAAPPPPPPPRSQYAEWLGSPWGGPQLPRSDRLARHIGAPLPETKMLHYGRGFACFENAYVFNGTLRLLASANPAPRAPGNPLDRAIDEWTLEDWMEVDGSRSGASFLSASDAELLSAGGAASIPSLDSAITMLEWPRQRFLAHFGHFVEGIAGSLTLEALDGLPPPQAVLCCGCHFEEGLPFDRYESFLGSNRLNALVVAALWEGAPLVLCSELAGAAPPQDRWPGFPATPLDPPVRGPDVPWALHVARTCLTDRRSAHEERGTKIVNNFNSQLVALASDEVQVAIDA